MRKWFVGSLIAIVGVSLTASFAVAATPTPAPASQGGQGLEISPPVIELNADPGQTVKTTISVRNITNGPLTITGQVNDFGAGNDESGSPKLLLEETGETRYSLKYWIQQVPSLSLASQELKKIPVTIQVPKNAEPGGHFGVVRFSGEPPSLEGTGVSLSASVGTLVLMRVNGNITHGLSVATFDTGIIKNEKFVAKSFFETPPVTFEARIKNDGSVHEKPVGTITFKNLFWGKKIVLAVNTKGGNVLPGSIRKFDVPYTEKNLFGYYTAKLEMNYLDGTKQVSSSSINFWVIPWKMILSVVIILIFLFFLLRIALRKYNAYVIAMARKH